MTNSARAIKRSVRNFVVVATIGAAGGTAFGQDGGDELLELAADEPLTVRFSKPVRASHVGSGSFRIVRESDGEPAAGRYVAGTFLRDPGNGAAVVVDPSGYVEAVQVVSGLDRKSASAYVERALGRYARSGQARDIAPLRHVISQLRNGLAGRPAYQPEILSSFYGGYRTLPTQDATATPMALALRKLQSGDDALWERYILESDVSAFYELSFTTSATRFVHAVDPLTGDLRAESEFRRRENRRYLFTGARTGRVFTFVPDVPETLQLTDTAYAANEQYRVSFAGLPNPLRNVLAANGDRAQIRRGVAHFETTFWSYDPAIGGYLPRFELSELQGAQLYVTDVTPPNGERLVDPTTDWESPSNRIIVAEADRAPFVARVRFNQPLDPRSVNPTSFTITQTSGQVGTADERPVWIGVPTDVRLRQSRLGDVEVEITPRIPLDPSAVYRITVRNIARALDGRSNPVDYISEFSTAPLAAQKDAVVEGFDYPYTAWQEAGSNPRTLFTADASRDPEALGFFVPFVGDDPRPVTAIESPWFSGQGVAPRYEMLFDDPETPGIEGTNFHAPPGSSVRFLARTTYAAADSTQFSVYPHPYLARPWVELDAANPSFLGFGYIQLRIEFTLPPEATPSTPDLPYVERVSVVSRWP